MSARYELSDADTTPLRHLTPDVVRDEFGPDLVRSLAARARQQEPAR